jgi:hypothetical protein
MFADGAADFVPAVERVFGERPRVLDGSRAVLLDYPTAGGSRAAEPPARRSLLKLQLEAGERELWLIERHGALEHRLGYVPVRGSIEAALQHARDLALEQTGEPAIRPERTRKTGSDPSTELRPERT